MRRRPLRPLAVLAVCVGLFACARSASKPAPAAPVVVAAPDGVVVTVSAPSLTKVGDGLRAYADAVQPGAGALLADAALGAQLAARVGATSLDGLDLAAPIHAVVLDPTAGGPGGLVLVAKLVDRGRLDAARGAATIDAGAAGDGGWAVIGDAAAVAAVAGWARAELVRRPPPAIATADVRLDRLLALHGGKLELFRPLLAAQPGLADVADFYIDGLRGVVADSAGMTATLEADGAVASVELAFAARPGTRLAAFAAAQTADDFALLGRLPATGGNAMVIAGRFAFGPYRDAWLEVTARMVSGGAGDAALMKAYAALADVGTGVGAGLFDLGVGDGMVAAGLYGVTDAAAADRVIAETLTAMKGGVAADTAGMKRTLTGTPEAGRHGGVAVRALTTTLDLADAPAEQRAVMDRMMPGGRQRMEVAAFDDVVTVALGRPAAAVIDAARGKGARYVAPAPVADALADARARRASLVALMDLAAIVAGAQALTGGAPATPTAPSAPMRFSLSGQDGAVRFRVAMPASGLAAMIAAQRK